MERWLSVLTAAIVVVPMVYSGESEARGITPVHQQLLEKLDKKLGTGPKLHAETHKLVNGQNKDEKPAHVIEILDSNGQLCGAVGNCGDHYREWIRITKRQPHLQLYTKAGHAVGDRIVEVIKRLDNNLLLVNPTNEQQGTRQLVDIEKGKTTPWFSRYEKSLNGGKDHLVSDGPFLTIYSSDDLSKTPLLDATFDEFLNETESGYRVRRGGQDMQVSKETLRVTAAVAK